MSYPSFRRIVAKYPGTCGDCRTAVSVGDSIGYNPNDDRRVICKACIVEADEEDARDRNWQRFVPTAKRTGDNRAEVEGCYRNQVAGIVRRDLGVEPKKITARYFPSVGGCSARFDCWIVTF